MYKFGFIEIIGDNAVDFLQNQATCNFKKYKSCRGAFCDHKGKVFASFYVKEFQSKILLRMPQDNIENTINSLNTFARFSKVQLLDVSDQYQTYFSTKQTEAAIVHSRNNINLYELWDKSDSSITSALTGKQILQNFIALGIVEVTKQISNEYFAHNIGLQFGEAGNSALDFEKGCYRGQEIIARMHYIGKVKKQLYRVASSAPIADGAELFNGTKAVGKIITASANIGLAVATIPTKQQINLTLKQDKIKLEAVE